MKKTLVKLFLFKQYSFEDFMFINKEKVNVVCGLHQKL